jgi:hypothetical protein
MAIVKLQNAGESLTWTIKKAEVVAGKFGNQVKFENDGGDLLFIPHDSAMRQLDRVNLTVVDCVGETLTIARDENKKGGAPYWSIRPAGPGDRQPADAKRISSPYQAPSIGKVPGLDDFPDEEYGASVHSPSGVHPTEPEWVTQAQPGERRDVLAKPPVQTVSAGNLEKKVALTNGYLDLLKYVKAHSGLTDENAIQAAAATLFIAFDKAGIR